MSDPPARRLTDTQARRLTGVLAGASALLGLWLCARPDPVSIAPVVPTSTMPVPAAAPPEPTGPTPVESCDALAGTEDPADHALLPYLCPDHPLTLRQARDALLAAPTVTAALALRPALTPHPELQALVDLVAATGAAAPADAAIVGDPAAAAVVPLDATKVGWARRAEMMLVSKDVAHDDRTRARALLAKLYLHALVRLGLPPGQPLPPFARRVAALAAYHARRFCDAYWQRRVRGLADLFADVEAGLGRVVVALRATPYVADDALTVWEHERAVAYVTRSGPAQRLDDPTLAPTPAARIERLVGQGLFDLAVEHAADLAADGDPPVGLATAEQLLRDAAARTDRPEAIARIEARLDDVRRRARVPPLTGDGEVEPPTWPWPSADRVATEAEAWWAAADDADGFARKHAIARAIATTRDRPDAARRVLEAASTATAPAILRRAREVLRGQLRSRDPARRADRELMAGDDPDLARRLTFAADADGPR